MVVITILAILATAGISTYTGYIKKSIDVKTLAYVTAWNSAIIQLKADSSNGAIPTPDAINTYLAVHPVSSRMHIASLVESISNIWKVFGATITSSAISKYPALGRTDCVQSSWASTPCQMITVFLSNGEFFTTYGVLSLSNLVNYHSVTGISGLSWDIHGSTRWNSGIISSSIEVISDANITTYKSWVTATVAYKT